MQDIEANFVFFPTLGAAAFLGFVTSIANSIKVLFLGIP